MSNLTSDELGEKGESRFRELCADAKLVCNKSERDRVGWDFTVDFGFSSQGDISLDKRLPPVSCQVQVKTITSNSRSVRVRLNMAERLAKDVKPAFIFVLRVNDKNSFIDAYLLHIYGSRLEAILKRLRKESAAGTEKDKINRLEITFTPKDSEIIDVSGDALRSSLDQYCGRNLSEYSANKQGQIRKLGYEGAPFELNVSFDANNQAELEEIFLGLRQNVPVSNLAAFETRFNIKLPLERPQPARVTIQPSPSSKCRLTFRAAGLLPTSFDADVYFVPPMISLNGQKRIRIKGDFAELHLFHTKDGTKIDLKTIPPDGPLATIDEWTTFYRVCQTLYLRGTIEIERVGEASIFLNLADQPTNFPDSFASLVVLCEQFSDLARYARMNNHHKFDMKDIVESQRHIFFVHSLLSGKRTDLTMIGETISGARTIQIPATFLVSSFDIGDLHVGYYMKTDVSVEVNGAQTSIRLSDMSFREVRIIERDGGRSTYIDRVKQVENTVSVGALDT